MSFSSPLLSPTTPGASSSAAASASSSSAAAEFARGVEKMTLASQAAQLWVHRGYATSVSSSAAADQAGAGHRLSRLFMRPADFAVDNNTFNEAQIRAAFYPKFENEKSDLEGLPQVFYPKFSGN